MNYIIIGAFVSLIVSPTAGVWSDYVETRFGKRAPFIFVCFSSLPFYNFPPLYFTSSLSSSSSLLQSNLAAREDVYPRSLYASAFPRLHSEESKKEPSTTALSSGAESSPSSSRPLWNHIVHIAVSRDSTVNTLYNSGRVHERREQTHLKTCI